MLDSLKLFPGRMQASASWKVKRAKTAGETSLVSGATKSSYSSCSSGGAASPFASLRGGAGGLSPVRSCGDPARR
jgi:hypothetical protein